MELGTGFAFVGRQKEIVVSGKTRKIDLLFYHIRLRYYVIVELKVTAFEPEFAGKLNFYVSAVDELIKTADDKDLRERRWGSRVQNREMEDGGMISLDKLKRLKSTKKCVDSRLKSF